MKCISFYTLHACSKYMYLWIHISDMPSASSPENVSWGGSLGAIGASESARGWGAACDLPRVTTMVSHVRCKYQFLNESLHQAETYVSPASCWWDTSKQTIFNCNLWNLRWLWHIHGYLASPCNRPVLVAQGRWFYTYLEYHKCGGRTLTCWVPSSLVHSHHS